MALSTQIRVSLNRALAPFNLRLDTLTAERAEADRLAKLDAGGQFARAAFPVLSAFGECHPELILSMVGRFRDMTDTFSVFREDRYSFRNDYFTSPDAEVAYALVRELGPRRIVEVGSGNSTRLFRQAIEDGGLPTELVSIDPFPRKSVKTIADRVLTSKLEDVPMSELLDLRENDVLFIDSSHEVRTGNDVVCLFLNVLPQLAKGVVVHVHDIFLPYEYPRRWIVESRWPWNEQYLVHAMLQGSNMFQVLWAGQFFQRTLPGFSSHFEASSQGAASSLWLRKCI